MDLHPFCFDSTLHIYLLSCIMKEMPLELILKLLFDVL
jgi:hypothetical protein